MVGKVILPADNWPVASTGSYEVSNANVKLDLDLDLK